QDFNLLYSPSRKKDGLPWDPPARVKGFEANKPFTLFSQKYLAVILDEGHMFRNVGPKHLAAMAIMDLAAVRLVLTATPLQTSTKDVAAIARLVGVPYFLTEKALEEERTDMARVRRARATLPPDYDPLNDDDDDPIKSIGTTIAQRMQVQFDDRMIRRTRDSLDWEGKNLLKLKPYETIMMKLTLEDRELEILDRLAAKVRRTSISVSNSNSIFGIVSHTFYLEYRMGVCCPRTHQKDPIPKYRTMQEWQSNKSTKLDTCARLVSHLLSHDNAPPIKVKDGKVTFRKLSAEQREHPKQSTKILIYQEFPSLGPLLRNVKQVFDLYGITYVYIAGNMSFQERAKIVERFCNDPNVRVLVFSSVGSIGLNLSIACIVIFFVSRSTVVKFMCAYSLLIGSTMERAGQTTNPWTRTPPTPEQSSQVLSPSCRQHSRHNPLRPR
ncbi:hypothetical protein GALMADRAFT_77269, partial [Galerina marginata CBS 339.88]